jgi:hypothetical protein
MSILADLGLQLVELGMGDRPTYQRSSDLLLLCVTYTKKSTSVPGKQLATSVWKQSSARYMKSRSSRERSFFRGAGRGSVGHGEQFPAVMLTRLAEEMMRISNTTSDSTSKERSACRSRVLAGTSTLSKDVVHSMPPFWTPSNSHPRARAEWKDVNLLRDTKSNETPVFINLPWKEEKFGRQEWMSFWLQPDLRKLLTESFKVPKLPVASVVEPNGVEHTFWDASVRFDRDGSSPRLFCLSLGMSEMIANSFCFCL